MNDHSAHVKQARSSIRRSQSEREVLAAVLDYVRGLPPELMARLPDSCRPQGLADRDAIVAFNLELARRELTFEGSDDDAALLREMLAVMSDAALRFAQLATDMRPRGGS